MSARKKRWVLHGTAPADVLAASAPGQGTRITILLPRGAGLALRERGGVRD